MPVYCYRTEDGEKVELLMTVSERNRRERDWIVVLDDGRKAKRDLRAEHGGFKANISGWPMKCDAAGVHPDQAKEAYDESVRMGTPTEFDRTTGQAVFRDRAHRRDYLRSVGLHDRDGGYGD